MMTSTEKEIEKEFDKFFESEDVILPSYTPIGSHEVVKKIKREFSIDELWQWIKSKLSQARQKGREQGRLEENRWWYKNHPELFEDRILELKKKDEEKS